MLPSPSSSSSLFRRVREHSLLLPLGAALLAGLILVPPWGDFPIVDDFFHARVLRESLEQGTYAKHPFVSVSLIATVVWALPFTVVFDTSYDTLRMSTLVLALIGAWAVARTARDCGAPRWAAVTAGAVLLFNPVYYVLSYSFMSDVPHVAAAALSVLCFVRGLQRKAWGWVLGGVVFGGIAFFCRQPGLVVLMAFGCLAAGIGVMALTKRLGLPSLNLGPAMTPAMTATLVAGSAVVLVLIFLFLRSFPYSRSQTNWLATEGMWNDASVLQYRVWFCAVSVAYMGFFAGPIVLARVQGMALGAERWTGWRWGIACGSFCVLVVLSFAITPGMTRMPYLGDYFYDLGVGNLTFTGTSQLDREWKPFSIGPLWWPLTLLAWLGGAMLCADILASLGGLRSGDEGTRTRALVVLFLAGVMAAFIVNNLLYLERARFERYILPALAPALVILALPIGANKLTRLVGIGSAVLLAAGTMVLQQDYFGMTTARWAATDWLLEVHGADAAEVDGGYEYNGVYTMDAFVASHEVRSFDDQGEQGYWVLGDRYAIDLLPRDGYHTIHEQPYFSWLGFETRKVLVMEKGAPAS